MNKQPNALYLLNFVSMWECFSYYGMRALLVLFMTQELLLGDAKAFALYALYTTLIEFGGVIGGIVADRFLGLKRAIVWGGWTIAIGHVLMTVPDSEFSFFLGLGFIIAGTSFFRTNAAAFLGKFYSENDPRRDAGYTIYYTGINIGGFLASIVCGIVGEYYGWHAGFGIAALGMLAGNLALWIGSRVLQPDEESDFPDKSEQSLLSRNKIAGALILSILAPLCAGALYYYETILMYLPLIIGTVFFLLYRQTRSLNDSEKKGLLVLSGYLAFLVLFYACEEQLGSTLVLFSDRHAARETSFGLVPATALITFNPFTILLMGPLLSRLMAKVPIRSWTKIAISFGFLAAAFGVLWGGCLLANEVEIVPLSFVIISIVLIATGEIFIGPTVYAVASQFSPKGAQGMTMSLVTLGYALANLLSGVISSGMAVNEGEFSLQLYMKGFCIIGGASLFIAVMALMMNQQKKVFA